MRLASVEINTRALDIGPPETETPAREAGVAELVDARDSKSRSFGSVGSIPTAGIYFQGIKRKRHQKGTKADHR